MSLQPPAAVMDRSILDNAKKAIEDAKQLVVKRLVAQLDAMKKRMDFQEKDSSSKIANLSEKISGLQATQTESNALLQRRLDTVDSLLDGIEARLGSIDDLNDCIHSTVQSAAQRMDHLETSVSKKCHDFDEQQSRHDVFGQDIIEKVANLENSTSTTLATVRVSLGGIEEQLKSIGRLESDIQSTSKRVDRLGDKVSGNYQCLDGRLSSQKAFGEDIAEKVTSLGSSTSTRFATLSTSVNGIEERFGSISRLESNTQLTGKRIDRLETSISGNYRCLDEQLNKTSTRIDTVDNLLKSMEGQLLSVAKISGSIQSTKQQIDRLETSVSGNDRSLDAQRSKFTQLETSLMDHESRVGAELESWKLERSNDLKNYVTTAWMFDHSEWVKAEFKKFIRAGHLNKVRNSIAEDIQNVKAALESSSAKLGARIDSNSEYIDTQQYLELSDLDPINAAIEKLERDVGENRTVFDSSQVSRLSLEARIDSDIAHIQSLPFLYFADLAPIQQVVDELKYKLEHRLTTVPDSNAVRNDIQALSTACSLQIEELEKKLAKDIGKRPTAGGVQYVIEKVEEKLVHLERSISSTVTKAVAHLQSQLEERPVSSDTEAKLKPLEESVRSLTVKAEEGMQRQLERLATSPEMESRLKPLEDSIRCAIIKAEEGIQRQLEQRPTSAEMDAKLKPLEESTRFAIIEADESIRRQLEQRPTSSEMDAKLKPLEESTRFAIIEADESIRRQLEQRPTSSEMDAKLKPLEESTRFSIESIRRQLDCRPTSRAVEEKLKPLELFMRSTATNAVQDIQIQLDRRPTNRELEAKLKPLEQSIRSAMAKSVEDMQGQLDRRPTSCMVDSNLKSIRSAITKAVDDLQSQLEQRIASSSKEAKLELEPLEKSLRSAIAEAREHLQGQIDERPTNSAVEANLEPRERSTRLTIIEAIGNMSKKLRKELDALRIAPAVLEDIQSQLKMRPTTFLVENNIEKSVKAAEQKCLLTMESDRAAFDVKIGTVVGELDEEWKRCFEDCVSRSTLEELETGIRQEIRACASRTALKKLEAKWEDYSKLSPLPEAVQRTHSAVLDASMQSGRSWTTPQGRTVKRPIEVLDKASVKRQRFTVGPSQLDRHERQDPEYDDSDLIGDNSPDPIVHDSPVKFGHATPGMNADESSLEAASIEESASIAISLPLRFTSGGDDPRAYTICTLGANGRIQDTADVPDEILRAASAVADAIEIRSEWVGQCLFTRSQQCKEATWSKSGRKDRACKMCTNACRPCLRIDENKRLLLLELPDEIAGDNGWTSLRHWVRVKARSNDWTSKKLWVSALEED